MEDAGADLVAAGRGQRYAVHVKSRLIRPGSRDGGATVVEFEQLQRLSLFAERFVLVPLLAQVVCLADEKLIHLFLLKAAQLAGVLPIVQNGYGIRFGREELEALARHPAVDYSRWREELIEGTWLGGAAVPNRAQRPSAGST